MLGLCCRGVAYESPNELIALLGSCLGAEAPSEALIGLVDRPLAVAALDAAEQPHPGTWCCSHVDSRGTVEIGLGYRTSVVGTLTNTPIPGRFMCGPPCSTLPGIRAARRMAYAGRSRALEWHGLRSGNVAPHQKASTASVMMSSNELSDACAVSPVCVSAWNQ